MNVYKYMCLQIFSETIGQSILYGNKFLAESVHIGGLLCVIMQDIEFFEFCL